MDQLKVIHFPKVNGFKYRLTGRVAKIQVAALLVLVVPVVHLGKFVEII